MKKFLSIVLALTMIFTLSFSSFAAVQDGPLPKPDYAYSVTVSEYDTYVDVRLATPNQIASMGISSDQEALIKSNAIEDELTVLSKKSVSELAKLGYNKSQIKILKNYSGERIENNVELKSVLASMTAGFSKVAASTSSLTIRADWEWSSCPILAGIGIEDMVAMRWQGTDNSGNSINLALNTSSTTNRTFCLVNYYSRDNVTYKNHEYATVKTDGPYEHAYAKIRMGDGKQDGYGTYYAKSGTLAIRVDRVGTAPINEAAFVFGYGHATVLISPSLSLPVGFGIGFSAGTSTMVDPAVRMTSTGYITRY